MKQILKVFIVIMLCNTTACLQDKSANQSKPDINTIYTVQSLTFTVNDERFEMIFVEGGTFTMGCTSEQGSDCEDFEKPVHQETVSDFYMGKHEVTQKLWRAVMGANPGGLYNRDCDDCPVEKVSWNDTQEFISKLNTLRERSFRLPTETEWEYAARGGKLSKGYKYSGSNNIDEVAWYRDNYQGTKYGITGTTHPAGSKKANELGLYDMSGNVWEWCSDWDSIPFIVYGTPLPFRRVLRGGSWLGSAQGCRVSYHDCDVPGYRDECGGFRLALTP